MAKKRTIEERFWSMVDKDGPVAPGMKTRCWLWTGAKTTPNKTSAGGYGLFAPNPGGNRLVHRMSYVWGKGAIPDGLQIDHRCNVKLCVRPSHLRALTAKQNSARRAPYETANAQKTHCPHGHEYEAHGRIRTYDGARLCGVCYPVGLPRKVKTECKRGHSLSDARTNSQGRRVCSTCYTAGGQLRPEFREVMAR